MHTLTVLKGFAHPHSTGSAVLRCPLLLCWTRDQTQTCFLSIGEYCPSHHPPAFNACWWHQPEIMTIRVHLPTVSYRHLEAQPCHLLHLPPMVTPLHITYLHKAPEPHYRWFFISKQWHFTLPTKPAKSTYQKEIERQPSLPPTNHRLEHTEKPT